jgi:hypothetical protein
MSATAHAAGSDAGSSVPQYPSGHLLIARNGGFSYVRFDDTPVSHADVSTLSPQQRGQREFLTPAVHRVPAANRSHNHHHRHHRVATRSV